MNGGTDGKTLASGSNGLVKLWNLATYQELTSFEAVGRVRSLAFSPEGTVLAAGTEWPDGSGQIHLWQGPRN